MRLIANRQLTGSYGSVVAGDGFDVEDATARQLINAGLARRAEQPRIQYETKIIAPEAPQVSARQPFRDSALPHEESPRVASESDQLLSSTDLPESGITDRGRRGRRS